MARHQTEMDNWEEYKAMYILSDILPEYGPYEKSESPDILSPKCGVEVVKATGQHYERFWSEYEKMLEEERKKPESEQNLQKFIIARSWSCGQKELNTALQRCREEFLKKVKKLKSYQQREIMGLFMYVLFFSINEEDLIELMNDFSILQANMEKKYQFAFLYSSPIGRIYILNLETKQYEVHAIRSCDYDDRLSKLSRQ